MKRCIKYRKVSRPELINSPDKFSFKFFKLLITKGESISLNKFLDQVMNKDKIIVFKNSKGSDAWLGKLQIS